MCAGKRIVLGMATKKACVESCADRSVQAVCDFGKRGSIRGLRYFSWFHRLFDILDSLTITFEQDNRVLLTEIDLWLSMQEASKHGLYRAQYAALNNVLCFPFLETYNRLARILLWLLSIYLSIIPFNVNIKV